MHILYFHQYFSTPAGAGGTRSYEMARALVKRGHKVTIVCGTSSKHHTGTSHKPLKRGVRENYVDGIRVLEIALEYSNYDSFPKRSLIFLRFALKSIRLASQINYDLLFATSTPLTASIPGIAMRLRKPGSSFIFEVRDLWPELPREMGVIKNPLAIWSLSALEWFSYKTAHACIGLSPGIVEGIKQRLPANSEKPIEMIPNGCDLKLFTPRHKNECQPTDNQQPAAIFRAVFTGAHGIANGLDAVLDAANVLKERGRKDIELTFIGEGKRKPRLIERARREQLNNCYFLEPIPKIELVRKMKNFHVGLMILDNVPAFYYGTSPNKFFDYIASGLPVVNNYPGWLAEMIIENECGLAVEPDNPTALADALENLARHPEKCRTMGRNARKLAESRFSREILAGKFCDFLENQTGQSDTRPNVWIINHYAVKPNDTRGARHFHLAKVLARHGWQPTIIASAVDHATGHNRLNQNQKYKLETVHGVQYCWLRTPAYADNDQKRKRNMLTFAWRATRLFRNRPPEIKRPDVIIGSSVHPFAALAASRLADKFKMPFIFEIRDLWPETLIQMGALRQKSIPARILYRIEKHLLRKAARIIALLPGIPDYVARQGFSSEKTVYIPNGTDINEAEKNGAEHETKINNQIFTFMYFGAFGNANDLPTMIEAYKLFKEKTNTRKLPTRFRMIGEGPMKPALKELAAKLKLNDVSIEEPVNREKIPELAENADAFVITVCKLPELYRYGISMNKLFDYMVAGKPVLIANCALNDPIKEANAGISVESEDSQALAGAMQTIYQMPAEKRARLGANGRKFVEENHDYDKLGSHLVSILNEVRDGKGGVGDWFH